MDTAIDHPLTRHAALSTAPEAARELAEWMEHWDTATVPLPRLQTLEDPEEGCLYTTELTAGPVPLESWVHLRQLLEEVIARADAAPDAFQYLMLTRADQSTWAQMTPLGPDAHYVELSDGSGWVDELAPADPDRPWSTDQTEAIMRLWVSRCFQRADARRQSVPRSTSGSEV